MFTAHLYLWGPHCGQMAYNLTVTVVDGQLDYMFSARKRINQSNALNLSVPIPGRSRAHALNLPPTAELWESD